MEAQKIHGEGLEGGSLHWKEQMCGITGYTPRDSCGPHGPVLGARGWGVARGPDQGVKGSSECWHRGGDGLGNGGASQLPVAVSPLQCRGSGGVVEEGGRAEASEDRSTAQRRQVEEVGHAAASGEASQGCPFPPQVVEGGRLELVPVHACARGNRAAS
jgi:hypothetical protein